MTSNCTHGGWRCLLLLIACGSSGVGCQKTELHPVQGRLLIGGEPAAGANLVFHPVDRSVVERSVALTKSDGTFRLMTRAADDGARAGNYVVTIFWQDPARPYDGCEGTDLIQHDLLRGWYFSSVTSPLRATIRASANDLVIAADWPRTVVNKRSAIVAPSE